MGTSRPNRDDGDAACIKDDEPFLATVTERADGEQVCTISRPPATERLLLSEWVCASGDSFVSLEEMR